MVSYIQDSKGSLWSRKQRRPIAKEIWETWPIDKVRNECGYPTFKGCHRVAIKLYYDAFDLEQWGGIERIMYDLPRV